MLHPFGRREDFQCVAQDGGDTPHTAGGAGNEPVTQVAEFHGVIIPDRLHETVDHAVGKPGENLPFGGCQQRPGCRVILPVTHRPLYCAVPPDRKETHMNLARRQRHDPPMGQLQHGGVGVNTGLGDTLPGKLTSRTVLGQLIEENSQQEIGARQSQGGGGRPGASRPAGAS